MHPVLIYFVGGSVAQFGGYFVFLYLVAEEFLYAVEFLLLGTVDERDGYAVVAGAGGAAYAVYVVLGLAGYVVVHHHGYVFDVDAAGQNVGRHENVDFARGEIVDHLLALLLVEVAVHFGGFIAHLSQFAGEILYGEFGGGEHNDPLRAAGLENMFQDCGFLPVVTYVGALVDFFRRTRYGDAHFHGVGEDFVGEPAGLLGHRGGEEKGLAVGGKALHYLHDIVVEAHVEHAVSLVEDEIRHPREVNVAHLYVVEQASRGGDHHVGAHFKSALLAGEFGAVGAAVDGERTYRQKVGESFHLAVDLLHELAGRCHDYAVDGIVGKISVGNAVDHRKKVCGRLARSGLGACHKVVAFEYYGDCLFLDRGTFFKRHRVERVEYIIAEIKLFEFHFSASFFSGKSPGSGEGTAKLLKICGISCCPARKKSNYCTFTWSMSTIELTMA